MRYFVSVHTRIHFTTDSYTHEAAKMADLMNQVFSSTQYMEMFSKSPLTSCHTDVEISRDEDGLIAKCVVDMEGEKRPTLDKGKLSTVLKTLCPADWPSFRIEKRAVD